MDSYVDMPSYLKEIKRLKLKAPQREAEVQAIRLVENIKRHLSEPPASVIYNIYTPLPKWERLSRVDKVFGIFGFLVPPEQYVAFTLRFSRDFIRRTHRSSKKPITYISDRLHQNSKNSLGYVPKFIIAAENDKFTIGKIKSFHIHGIIESNGADLAKIRHIVKLTAFGKDYQSSKMNRSMFKPQPLSYPLGWLLYMTKNGITAYNQLYINRTLTHEFKTLYTSAEKAKGRQTAKSQCLPFAMPVKK